MPNPRTRAHKHFRLDPRKLRRAQRLVRAKTETETVERALDRLILECQNDRRILAAHDRFARSGAVIKDVYGVLDD